MALGVFTINIGEKSYTWKRTFENMNTVETLTGKSLAKLAMSGLSMTTSEIFSILRTVLSKDDVTDKAIKQYIADDFKMALDDVADVLMFLLGKNDDEPAEQD